MKYFTPDWYDEMQVSSRLMFPETEEEWIEYLTPYDGHPVEPLPQDHPSIIWERNILLKFLPAYFHPAIVAGTIRTEYPTQEFRARAAEWIEDDERRQQRINHEYYTAYTQIQDRLPPQIVDLHGSLHDARVMSYEHPASDVFIIMLDCRPGFRYFTDVRLTFTGVTKLVIPDEFAVRSWLYDEVYLASNGFEYHALLQGLPAVEFEIIAEDVLIEPLGKPEHD